MIGRTISHYRILEKLGEGGMGTVYKAEDLKLKRTVALKFLPRELTSEPEAKTRFVREAQAAATLSHPNICTIYEIDEYEGQSFIAMECCTGETLKDKIARGPLKLEEAFDLASQIAAGLGQSHDRYIVHRDIKPANCFITTEGQVKILDFGLAKLTGETRVTRTGTTLGTAAYMSPEQAQGKAADHRSDIWSLGVVLYEMLAGRLPFKGENAPALMYAIVNEKQPPLTTLNPEIPLEVEQLADRALAKDPGKRYQKVVALKADLNDLQASLDLLPKRSQLQLKLLRRRRTITASMVMSALVIALAILGVRYLVVGDGKIDSIAVLPFENLSDASEDDLVEGMTLELTAALGQLSGFVKVMPYRSMKMYRGTDKSVADIAERTGVKALVAGTISQEGNLIKAIIEMIEGSSERLLWTRAFEFERQDLKGMMDDIMNEILARADIGLTPAEQTHLAESRPANSAVYESYLRGRALVQTYSEENMVKGIELLEQAVRVDTRFAPAYVQLASAYSDFGTFYRSGHEEYPKARKAALRALELDDSQAGAYMALGMVQYRFEWDWSHAEQSFRQALDLDPDNADIHREYAIFLTFMARFEDARAEYQIAVDLDPLTIINHQNMGWAYYHAGRFDESIARFEKLLALLQEFPNPAKEKQIQRQLIWNYIMKGQYDRALTEIDAWEARWQLTDNGDRAWAYVEMGRRDEVEDLIAEILSNPGINPWLAAKLGDVDLAFRRLEKLYAERDTYMIFLKMAIELENLRLDSRYEDLLRRMNFPD